MDKKKILIILSIIIALVVLIFIIIKATTKEEIKQEPSLYFTNENGEKINSSKGVNEKQTIGFFEISNGSIVRNGGVSTLTAKVTNNGEDAENVRFKVTFYDEKNNVITITTVIAGKMKKGQTTEINAGISADISETAKITYEMK